MEIAFLMDPLGSINPVDDTTSHIMYACNQRGHTVYFLEPHDVYIRGDEVVARMRNVTVARDLSMAKFLGPCAESHCRVPLKPAPAPMGWPAAMMLRSGRLLSAPPSKTGSSKTACIL